MFNLFEKFESNLGRAGWLLILEISGGVALGMALPQMGFSSDLAIPCVWLANLATAWFLSRAAREQGRNPWLFALSALGPPLAVLAFSSLYSRDLLRQQSRVERSVDQA